MEKERYIGACFLCKEVVASGKDKQKVSDEALRHKALELDKRHEQNWVYSPWVGPLSALDAETAVPYVARFMKRQEKAE